MQCRGDERKGCHTCHGAQWAVVGVGALLKGTTAMPGMWTLSNCQSTLIYFISIFLVRVGLEAATFKSRPSSRSEEKVSPWSQLFRCAGFKGSSTDSELAETTWLSSFNRKMLFCHRLRSGDTHASVLSHLGCHGDFETLKVASCVRLSAEGIHRLYEPQRLMMLLNAAVQLQ